MKLIPLGGAEEIGASCSLLEIGGHKILVDAGIRIGGANNINSERRDPLPDLARITDFGGIEAILVTHAHTDHTGALPLVHQAYPNVPVYATVGTQALVSVLLNDAVRLMQSRFDSERELPLYGEAQVESLFTRMQSVQLGQTLTLFGGEVAATFFPAGHILGAACIGLQSERYGEESIFFSGDISATPQLTVGGMLPPVSVATGNSGSTFRPQVVMVESTYGNRLHANRANEERRLAETVAAVVEQGGRVLIPAFAVGRAQEVLLILAQAMRRQEIASFPVWVDGMVKSVCSVYAQHPYDLARGVQRQIIRQGNPFFGPAASRSAKSTQSSFQAIITSKEREQLAESGKPGCIVASSGMLSGGPSAFYASYLVKEPKSAIFITGYQDEESPGRALLALAETTDPGARRLRLGPEGESVAVVCRVAKYSLSAHADAGELAALINQLNPKETVLVHGAGGAREALSDLLSQNQRQTQNQNQSRSPRGREQSPHLPHSGDELIFEGRKKAKSQPVRSATLIQPSEKEREEEKKAESQNKPPTPKEAPPVGLWPESLEQLNELSQHLVAQLGTNNARSRIFTIQELVAFWQAWKLETVEVTTKFTTANSGPVTAEGATTGQPHLELVSISNSNPLRANGSEKSQIEWFSTVLDEDKSESQGEGKKEDEEEGESQAANLPPQEYERFTLLLAHKGSVFKKNRKRPFMYQFSRRSKSEKKQARKQNKIRAAEDQEFRLPGQPPLPLEQNAALAVVEQLIDAKEAGLYRKGAVTAQHKLMLYFHFPAVAAQLYQAQIEQIIQTTGWKVELNHSTNQEALVKTLAQLLPTTLRLNKAPSLHRDSQTASAVLDLSEATQAQPLLGQSHTPAHNRTGLASHESQIKTNLHSITQVVSGAGSNGSEPNPTITLAEVEQDIVALARAFHAQTGWTLEAKLLPEREATLNGVASGQLNQLTPARSGPNQRLEINNAFSLIERRLHQVGANLLKKSRKHNAATKEEFIELSFVTSQLGERYRMLLDELETQTGWAIRLNPEPQHQALLQLGEQMLNQAGISSVAIKGWSIYREKATVRVKLARPLLTTRFSTIALIERFQELSGWKLEVKLEGKEVS
jgi:Cft2 family RNA processing exonuclease